MIAISATGKKTRDLMDLRFARCPYFVLISNEGTLTLENPYKMQDHDTAISVIEWLEKLGVNKIITGEIGPKAHYLLVEKKIQIILMDVEKISIQHLRKQMGL